MKLHFKPSEQPRSYTVHQWQCDPLRLSATGEKLRVTHYTAVPNITRPLGVQPPELTAGQILHTDVTDYLLGGRVTMRDGRVDKVLFEGGYCQAAQAGSSSDSFAFYYYNQDHLGNIREVVDATGTVRQVTNYYPFGTPYCDSPSAQSPDLQPYKYNGKELDRMHGLDTYDYGARNDFHVHREYQTGDGYADLVLIPRKNVIKPAVVIELKYDKTAVTAISQIKEKHYPEKIADYTGDILLCGISYDREAKTHSCRIERWTVY